MAPPLFPALVVTGSATTRAGITHAAIGGYDLVTLPIIVTSGAVSGQANVGDNVYVAANEFAWALLFDANTDLSFDAVGPLQAAFFTASPTLTWKRSGRPAFPITNITLAPGNANTLALGTNNVPTQIATPATPAGFVAIVLGDGSFGFIPYWK